MAYIKIHAGNFLTGYNDYVRGGFRLRTQAHRFRGEFVPLNEVDSFEVKTEEHMQRVSDAFGLAAVGSLILGPVGLLAGLLLGGKKKEITFTVKFKDGRQFLATADSKIFKKIQAAMFQQNIAAGELVEGDTNKQA
ncbi:hypothetical protein JD969_03855 [Planctomycetota bacterium]|nr:hypothetical protein JD969_03855 [Planctomycetota bacterium]